MLTETGRVVAVEEDGLWVETIRRSTCGSCAASAGCGHGLLARIADGRTGLVRVLQGPQSPSDCRVDDRVRIGIPERLLLRGSLVVYLLPLAALLAGAALGMTLAGSDAGAVAGAAGGFAGGLGLVRLHAWRHRNDRGMHPVLLERLGPAAADPGPG